MVETGIKHRGPLVLDASPLMYLAKLEALDVLTASGFEPVLPPAVERETSRPEVAYRHPDAARIADALREGRVKTTQLNGEERTEAARLERAVAGLGRGECEVLAIARLRSWPGCLFERRAIAIAETLGVRVVRPAELLFAGTDGVVLLEERVKGFARLVELRLEDAQALLDRVERRR